MPGRFVVELQGQDACTGGLVPLHEELGSLQKRIADHDNGLKELKNNAKQHMLYIICFKMCTLR